MFSRPVIIRASMILNHARRSSCLRTGAFQIVTRAQSTQPRTYFYNSTIPYDTVHLVNPNSNTLGPSKSLAALLASTDLEKDRIELVTSHPQPIVRIVSNEQVRQRRKEEKQRLKDQQKSRKEKKQIQMTWGVDGHDLERKLAQARAALSSGHPVNVVISKKGGVPMPAPSIMSAKVQGIVTELDDVAEVANDPSFGKQLTTIYLRPVSSKGSNAGQE